MSAYENNVIPILRREIREWKECITESQGVIDKVNRDISSQEAVIEVARKAIADLQAAIALLESQP